MKLRYYLLLFSLVLSFSCISQDLLIPIKPTSLDLPLGLKFDDNENSKEGSPYLTAEWREIKMTRKDNSSYLLPEGKYNVFVEGLVVNFCCEKYYISAPREIKSFEFDNRTFIGLKYEGKFGFFEELSTNEGMTLLCKPVCQVRSGTPGNGIVAATPDRYFISESYYVRLNDGSEEVFPIEIKGRKLSVNSDQLAGFGEYLKTLKKHRMNQTGITEAFEGYGKQG